MSDQRPFDDDFAQLAAASESVEPKEKAPSRLKSRIYSAMIDKMEADNPLRVIGESKTAGRGLCVFEEAMRVLPVGNALHSMFYCRYCHARVVAEQFEKAPIFWGHCPYVEFQNR